MSKDKETITPLFMSVGQIARYLGVSRSGFYNILKRCPDFPKPCGAEFGFMQTRYSREAVDAWIARCSLKQSSANKEHTKEEAA